MPSNRKYSKVQQIKTPVSAEGQRLDNYLFRLLKGVPRSHVYRLIREGQVRVNGSRSRVFNKLVAGDLIRLPPVRIAEQKSIPLPEELQNLRERVLYEDERLLVIDKPAGVSVHGGSGLPGGVIEGMRSNLESGVYLELVHRLDRETSGCLMLAKDPKALRAMHKYLRDPSLGEIQKKYLSLLIGDWTNGPRKINLSLSRVKSKNDIRRSVVTETGRKAESTFVPVRRFKGHVLVEIELKTGRMHQIRAHSAAIGFPVGGDQKYGSRDGNRNLRRLGLRRLFLHASELRLKHPETGKSITVKATIPRELRDILKVLP